MPLSLQLCRKQADVWLNFIRLLLLLILYPVGTANDARGMPCEPASEQTLEHVITCELASQDKKHTCVDRQALLRTGGRMRVPVFKLNDTLGFVSMAAQPPDAVVHLQGVPESRPIPGLGTAVD